MHVTGTAPRAPLAPAGDRAGDPVELGLEGLRVGLSAYSRKAIADAAGVGLDAAAKWKAGQQGPGFAQLCRLVARCGRPLTDALADALTGTRPDPYAQVAQAQALLAAALPQVRLLEMQAQARAAARRGGALDGLAPAARRLIALAVLGTAAVTLAPPAQAGQRPPVMRPVRPAPRPVVRPLSVARSVTRPGWQRRGGRG